MKNLYLICFTFMLMNAYAENIQQIQEPISVSNYMQEYDMGFGTGPEQGGDFMVEDPNLNQQDAPAQCPYTVNGVWSCGQGTRPCTANAVAGYDDQCVVFSKCTEGCWTGTMCKECVCQHGYIANGKDEHNRRICVERPKQDRTLFFVLVGGFIAILICIIFCGIRKIKE